MRSSILHSLLIAGAIAAAGTSAAQSGPSQVFVLNGNLFQAGNHATVARYDIPTGQYSTFDSIPAQFGADLLVAGSVLYAAADSQIVRYNIDTYTRTGSTVLHGVRKLAIWGSTLLATTGYGSTGHHLRAYDASTLAPLWSIAGITDDCEGITVWQDSAYVAVPGSFGASTGAIAVIDLNGQALAGTIPLDTMGRGVERIYAHAGKLFAISPIAYMNPWGAINEIDPATRAATHHRVDISLAHSPGFHAGTLYLRNGMNGLFSFDPNTAAVIDTSVIAGAYAAATIDTLGSEVFLTTTDYFSYGRLYRYTLSGTLLDSTTIGISPEAIAIDYRAPAARPDATRPGSLATWPVPATQEVHFRLPQHLRSAQATLHDMQGRAIRSTTIAGHIATLPVADLPAGMYLIQVTAPGIHLQGKFMK